MDLTPSTMIKKYWGWAKIDVTDESGKRKKSNPTVANPTNHQSICDSLQKIIERDAVDIIKVGRQKWSRNLTNFNAVNKSCDFTTVSQWLHNWTWQEQVDVKLSRAMWTSFIIRVYMIQPPYCMRRYGHSENIFYLKTTGWGSEIKVIINRE